jgi:hypothetical protein
MSCSFPRAGLTWAQDSFRIKVPKTCNEGLTPRPFLFSDGRIHRISIRKVMKSGASRISKNIRLFSVIHSGDGGDVRAVTKRGTALFPRPDHLRPNRIGSGTMPCRKRVSERLRRASTHYATRTAFLSQEKHVRVRRPCVFLDRDLEKVGADAIPEIWEGKHRGMWLRTLREGRSFIYPNPDNPFIRSAAAMPTGYETHCRRTPFSAAC